MGIGFERIVHVIKKCVLRVAREDHSVIGAGFLKSVIMARTKLADVLWIQGCERRIPVGVVVFHGCASRIVAKADSD
jgi:hypothetical protein